MCREKVNRKRCGLEEPGFKFRKHANVAAFGCPTPLKTPVVGLRSICRVVFRDILQGSNHVGLGMSMSGPRCPADQLCGAMRRGT